MGALDTIENLKADRERALSLTPVSRETTERLDRFVELLLERQQHTNLISESTIPVLWTRHIADSLQLLALAKDEKINARVWADLGSGAGFPGLVLACALTGEAGAMVHLIESNGKKATFLRDAARYIGAPAQIHAVRAEEFAKTFKGSLDVVTARAVAPLHKLLGLAQPLLQRGAQGLFLKGQDVEAELTEASKYWNIEASLAPSRTNPQSRIVVVRGLEQRPKQPSKR